MDEQNFEGTLVLEKLARINRVEEFLGAVDSDNFETAKSLMEEANIDAQTMAIVLKKMADPYNAH